MTQLYIIQATTVLKKIKTDKNYRNLFSKWYYNFRVYNSLVFHFLRADFFKHMAIFKKKKKLSKFKTINHLVFEKQY